MRAFAVLSERALESRFAAHAGTSMQPIVGRDQELALLLERWRQAEAGEGQMVLLTGEAGIGKSRIAEALIAALEDKPHINLRYQCSPYHTDSALWPVTAATSSSRLGIGPTTRRRAPRQAGGDAGAVGGVPRRGRARLSRQLLGIDAAARYGSSISAASSAATARCGAGRPADRPRGRAAGAVRAGRRALDRSDDPRTGGAGARRRWARLRVLMLITARPDIQPRLRRPPDRHAACAEQARPRPSELRSSTRMAGGKTLPDGLVDEIAARTDGVPLFVEEMTKAVLESGHCVREKTL